MSYQLSSSWTLVLKIFLPAFWLAFFTAFAVAVMFSDRETIGDFHVNALRIAAILLLSAGVFVFYKTVFRLMRLDMDETHAYVSNYLKSVRYPLNAIERIEISKTGIFTIGTLCLKGEGSFGNRIWFLASSKRIKKALKQNKPWTHLIQ